LRRFIAAGLPFSSSGCRSRNRAHIGLSPCRVLTTLLGAAGGMYSRAPFSPVILERRINSRHGISRPVSLLSDGDIRRYIAKGEIQIDPFDERNLTPNGYDVSIEEVVLPGGKASARTTTVPPWTRFALITRESIRMGR